MKSDGKKVALHHPDVRRRSLSANPAPHRHLSHTTSLQSRHTPETIMLRNNLLTILDTTLAWSPFCKDSGFALERNADGKFLRSCL